jgi:hypothetical protein
MMADYAPILDPAQQEEAARQMAARRAAATIAVPQSVQSSPVLKAVTSIAAPTQATPAPTLSGSSLPAVGANPQTPPPVSAEDKQVSTAQEQLDKAKANVPAEKRLMDASKNIGSDPDSFMGRHPGIARVARIGSEIGSGVLRGVETAGNIVAPRIMESIPGTQFNRASRIQGAENELSGAEKNREEAAQAQNLTAEAEKNKTLAAGGGAGKVEDLSYDKNGDPIGWHDAKGVLHSLDDPTTPPTIQSVIKAAKDKTVDEPKQPLGDAGVKQHGMQLETLTAGMDANQKAQFLAAYAAQPGDTHGVATKRLEDAKAAAALTGSERDRKIAQDTAQKNHNDQQANIHTSQTNSIYERVRQPYVTQLGKLHDSIQANEMAAQDLQAGSPVGQAMGIIKSLSAMAGGMGSGVRITQTELNSISQARTGAKWSEMAQHIATGKSLTQDQVTQLQSLLGDVHELVSQKERVLNAGLDKMNFATSPQEIKDADSMLRKQFTAIENHKAFTPSQLAHYAQTKGQPVDQVKQGMEKAGWVEVPE